MAGIGWERDANTRDVLDRRDLLSQPALVGRVLRRRREPGSGPQPVATLPFPKDDGTFRTTCVLDPFDDLWYSMLASVACPSINSALPAIDVVLSTRFIPESSGAFGAEGWRDAKKRRGASVDRSGAKPIGGFDVEQHYGTVSTAGVAQLLNSCLAPSWLVGEFEEFHQGLSAWPGTPPGILVGPMASAAFGTLALLPVDRVLQRSSVRFERWVDDITVEVRDEKHFADVRDAVDEQLRLGGQRLNPEKSWFESKAEEEPSQSESIPNSEHDGDEISVEALQEAVEAKDGRRTRYQLASLGGRPGLDAAPFVISCDDVWVLAPKYAGDYLFRRQKELTSEQLEQIVERFCRPVTRESASATTHGCRVLSRRRVPAAMGQRLFDAADVAATGPYRAVSPALYLASSLSKEKPRVRQERCIEKTFVLGDLNCQRGLIAGLCYDTRPKSAEAGLTAIERVSADLRPTVAWVRSGKS